MNFKKGDQISVIDEDLCGVIAFAKAEKVTFYCPDGFSHTRLASKVILDRSMPSKSLEKIRVKDTPRKKATRKVSSKALIVDLHLHEIIAYSGNLSNHDKVLAQLEHAREKFEFAQSSKIKKVIFIHGVGSGKLKKEVRKFLKSKANINFYDADFKKYGQGATEVEFYKFT